MTGPPPALIHQAVGRPGGTGQPRTWAASPDFPEAWLDGLEMLAARFGVPPAGFGEAFFTQPLPGGKDQVAVVRVTDRPFGGEPGPAWFHALLPARSMYGTWADPIALMDRHPPAWSARELPAVTELDPPHRRTPEELRPLLAPESAALMLGGAQVLVDGGRLHVERDAPDPALARGLWTLLPYSTREEVFLSSFVFSRELDLHLRVMPPGSPASAGFNTEDQARDYPVSRYERDLELAVMSGDQAELDRLFNRRSRRQTVRLLLTVLLGLAAVSAVMRLV